MKQLAIQAENISKQYRLGEVGTGTLSHDLNRFWYKLRGKEDPYLKIGEANDRSQKGLSEYVWSLKDINFEIEQGDAVGIIGRNGAGKSTLLKLLSKVTKPTTGHFKVNGRIASLLEVGTGFHPEMTGRENIYLNGAILGMRRHEITRKFDEIVDFSGVGGYIDTPVKRYSSGMYVRLAFAVAAHLESEILIVDEVLAVGDAEFQKKCLGKMGDVSKGEGRTVLFVSHNMGAVSSLCDKGLILNNGTIYYNGKINDILTKYATLNSNKIIKLQEINFSGTLKDKIEFTSILLNSINPFEQFIHLKPADSFEFKFQYLSKTDEPFRIIFGLFKDGVRVLSLHDVSSHSVSKGNLQSRFLLPTSFLRPGIYTVGLGSHSLKDEYSWAENVFDFEVIENFDDFNDPRDFGIINLKPFSKSERIRL